MASTAILLGITYSEFDNILGPKLMHCYPPGCLTINGKDEFEASLSDYAIVGKHLCGKVICIRTDTITFMNYSTALENKKYYRNALSFSFGFVLASEADIDPFERPLKKISSAFVAAEVENEFLFQSEKKAKLPEYLKKIYEDLKHNAEVFLPIDQSNFICVKLFLPFHQPEEVHPYSVPMLLYNKFALSSLPWDLTLRHLLPFIDGVSYIKKIAADADMDVDCVVRGISLLLYYNCVIVSDVFKFTNVYEELLPKGIPDLANEDSQKNLEKALCFCIKSSGRDALFKDSNAIELVKRRFFITIVSFLNILKNRKRLSELHDEFSKLPEEIHQLNIPRLLAYSESMGWIRRVHEYPCFSQSKKIQATLRRPSLADDFKQLRRGMSNGKSNSVLSSQIMKSHIRSSSEGNLEDAINLRNNDVIESLDGSRCLDDICCEYEIRPHDILDHSGIFVVYK